MADSINKSSQAEASKNNISGLSKGYLVAYNVVQSAGWVIILMRTLQYMIVDGGGFGMRKGVPGLYDTIKGPLRLYQTLAFLEVIHCMIGIVRSGVMVTLMQVWSRLFIVWGIIEGVHGVHDSIGLLIAVLGWSITEVIRYGYYASSLTGSTPYMVTYLRYTLFYVLYPIGVLGELIMMFTSLPVARASQQWSLTLPNPTNLAFSYYYWIIFTLVLYIPIFPKLYGHMISQRKKVLSKVKSD